MASVITEKCTNCKICGSVCPTESILPGAHIYVIDYDTCINCQVCVAVCPVSAIIPEKKPLKPK